MTCCRCVEMHIGENCVLVVIGGRKKMCMTRAARPGARKYPLSGGTCWTLRRPSADHARGLTRPGFHYIAFTKLGVRDMDRATSGRPAALLCVSSPPNDFARVRVWSPRTVRRRTRAGLVRHGPTTSRGSGGPETLITLLCRHISRLAIPTLPGSIREPRLPPITDAETADCAEHRTPGPKIM